MAKRKSRKGRSEFNGGSKQEFYVQYWRISQPLPSMLSPSIPDDRLSSDLQYTAENLEPEKYYIFQIIARNLISTGQQLMSFYTQRRKWWGQ
jgi:hypothetical protein